MKKSFGAHRNQLIGSHVPARFQRDLLELSDCLAGNPLFDLLFFFSR
jgi:hypothetical protein